MGKKALTVPLELIERKIYMFREQKVMLDRDLASIYGVETRALTQAVKRNIERFPRDFMFQLKAAEAAALRSQIVILNDGRGRHTKYAPYVFTELGVAMLSSVLRSERAVMMNILIMRAFVKLREVLATHKELAAAVADVRRRQDEQGLHISAIMDTINGILAPPPQPVPAKRRIGFPAADRSPVSARTKKKL